MRLSLKSIRAMLEFHCVRFFFKPADINQAFGFRAEQGKSQFHKGKAAGAGKNEQAQGLLCRLPGQGCRPRPRLKKGAAQPSALGTHWECACRGAGKTATGHLLPGRRQRACGAKLPYKGARGRGGGAFLTNPLRPQREWRRKRGHWLSLDCRWNGIALEIRS